MKECLKFNTLFLNAFKVHTILKVDMSKIRHTRVTAIIDKYLNASLYDTPDFEKDIGMHNTILTSITYLYINSLDEDMSTLDFSYILVYTTFERYA